MDQARRRVLNEIIRLARERLAASAVEVESLVASVRSQIDSNLSALLRTTT